MALNIDPKYNWPVKLVVGGLALAAITYFGLGDQLTALVDGWLGIPVAPVDVAPHSMLYFLPFIN